MSESYSYRIGLFPAPQEVGKTASILCPTGFELISVTLAAQSTIGRPALVLATFRRVESAAFMIWIREPPCWLAVPPNDPFGDPGDGRDWALDVETTLDVDAAAKLPEDMARTVGMKLCQHLSSHPDFIEVEGLDPVLLVRCVPE